MAEDEAPPGFAFYGVVELRRGKPVRIGQHTSLKKRFQVLFRQPRQPGAAESCQGANAGVFPEGSSSLVSFVVIVLNGAARCWNASLDFERQGRDSSGAAAPRPRHTIYSRDGAAWTLPLNPTK